MIQVEPGDISSAAYTKNWYISGAHLQDSKLHFTLGCTLSSVSSPPAEPQTPQCHRNVEQSPASQLVSGIWLKKRHIMRNEEDSPQRRDVRPSYLHVSSCHAAKVLLEDGQYAPHCGGESLRIQHAEGAATLGRWRHNRWLLICRCADGALTRLKLLAARSTKIFKLTHCLIHDQTSDDFLMKAILENLKNKL